MNEFDIPIFRKTYDLYRTLYDFRDLVPKADRYTLWQRIENLALDVLEAILAASQQSKPDKARTLENASASLNLLRVLIRLAKDVKALDQKKYLAVQQIMDEIGRMLGGWIKSIKEKSAPASMTGTR